MGYTFAANDIHREVSRSQFDILVVNMPNFTSEMKSTRSSIFCGSGGFSELCVLYGSTGWLPVLVLMVGLVDMVVVISLAES